MSTFDTYTLPKNIHFFHNEAWKEQIIVETKEYAAT